MLIRPHHEDHGDHVIVTESKGGNGGGVVMLGRSDGVLNPGGVRFGSAELYDVIETCFSSATTSDPTKVIVDSVAVGQLIDGGTDERVVLFVKLLDGHDLSAELEQDVKAAVRSRRSPRHVPAKVRINVCSTTTSFQAFLIRLLSGRYSKCKISHTL